MVSETLNPELVANINHIINQLVDERMSELVNKSQATRSSFCAFNNKNSTDVVTEVNADVVDTSVVNVISKKNY